MHIDRTAEVWEYDNSFYGFLTIVDKAFRLKKFPGSICTPETSALSLFFSEWIETNEPQAEKIHRRLRQLLTAENFQFFQDGFNATVENKELQLLETLEVALRTKDSLTNHIGHPSILAVQRGIKAMLGEAHLYTGFVRFEYAGKILFSEITPKHFSLPYICPHFAERYPLETIVIYDTTHRLLALIEQGRISFIENTDNPNLSNTREEEELIQHQWQSFLQAVTIQERANKKCQMNHLPLRFRDKMVDFRHSDKLSTTAQTSQKLTSMKKTKESSPSKNNVLPFQRESG
ncbi:TIGR03915 family putative DNA repair protein [Enterococcus sp. LJL51]|uniref:TIGR03915 family putative DNA repair protein n=1 Tax=Enterococcus sp. LJL51 TaxID=3416656 RepID=UPI003CF9DE44